MPVMTGLSGNEMYCLALKGLSAGDLVIGNSVYSLGFVGGIGASFKAAFGGEVSQISQIIHEGRQQSFMRMCRRGPKTRRHRHHRRDQRAAAFPRQHRIPLRRLDAPCRRRVEAQGDVLHQRRRPRTLLPARRQLHPAAFRVRQRRLFDGRRRRPARQPQDARPRRDQAIQRHLQQHPPSRSATDRGRSPALGANAVVGIKTEVMPFQGVHEMIMMGTASHNAALPAEHGAEPITSDLTCEEMWNMTNMGYMPLKLVMGTAVYSLGVIGGLKAMFKSFSRGEDQRPDLADLRRPRTRPGPDQARSRGDPRRRRRRNQNPHPRTRRPARIHGHRHGRPQAAEPLDRHARLCPSQAIIRDKDTWISSGDSFFAGAASGE